MPLSVSPLYLMLGSLALALAYLLVRDWFDRRAAAGLVARVQRTAQVSRSISRVGHCVSRALSRSVRCARRAKPSVRALRSRPVARRQNLARKLMPPVSWRKCPAVLSTLPNARSPAKSPRISGRNSSHG